MVAGPTSVAAPLVRGKCARFTLTDQCGFPQLTGSMYVTDAIIEVNSTKNIDAGDAISVRNMTGRLGIFEPGQSTFTNFSIAIHFTKMDPGVLTMLTGDPAVLNSDTIAKVVGFEEIALAAELQAFALEVWTDTSAAVCVSSNKLVGYMLYPLLSQGHLTIDTITDKEVTGTINAMSYGGASWGRGPYGAVADGSSDRGPVNTAASGVPSPGRLLVPVNANAHRHFEITPIAPPSAFTNSGPISITLPTSY